MIVCRQSGCLGINLGGIAEVISFCPFNRGQGLFLLHRKLHSLCNKNPSWDARNVQRKAAVRRTKAVLPEYLAAEVCEAHICSVIGNIENGGYKVE